MNTVAKVSEVHQTWPPEIMDWREYQNTPKGKFYYPSIYSLQWHIRKNRLALIRCGALLKLRGRDYLVIDPFEKSMIEIGSADARKELNIES